MVDDENSMVIVPSRFVSQDWVDYMSTPPSNRRYSPAESGARLNDILISDEGILEKRRNFLKELNQFNHHNRRQLNTPTPVRLKAKKNTYSQDYENVTMHDLNSFLTAAASANNRRHHRQLPSTPSVTPQSLASPMSITPKSSRIPVPISGRQYSNTSSKKLHSSSSPSLTKKPSRVRVTPYSPPNTRGKVKAKDKLKMEDIEEKKKANLAANNMVGTGVRRKQKSMDTVTPFCLLIVAKRTDVYIYLRQCLNKKSFIQYPCPT